MSTTEKCKHEWVLYGFNFYVCRKCGAELSEREGYWNVKEKEATES
jgi:hypothetical protein